jgi:hypothetical protein
VPRNAPGDSWYAGALSCLQSAVVLTTAVTVILALTMAALGTGRSVIAYQADRTGGPWCGGVRVCTCVTTGHDAE